MDVHVRLEVSRRREGLLADLALVWLLLKGIAKMVLNKMIYMVKNRVHRLRDLKERSRITQPRAWYIDQTDAVHFHTDIPDRPESNVKGGGGGDPINPR